MCQIHHHEKGLMIQVDMMFPLEVNSSCDEVFPLEIKASCDEPKCFKSTTKEDASWMWHHGYGHLSFNGLKTLQYKQMVTGLPMLQCP